MIDYASTVNNRHLVTPNASDLVHTSSISSSSNASSSNSSFTHHHRSSSIAATAPLPPPRHQTVTAQPNYAFLSVLSKALVRCIRGLEHVRELFCANEYPESFTGQEAIKMLHDLLDGIPESYCILVANALMKSKPPLFDPIHYSQKSIIQGTVFNSPDEYYTLQDDNEDQTIPSGVLTGLLECYTYRCLPGKGGCYAPRCPNKPEEQQQLASTTTTGPLLSPSSELSTTQTAWAQRVPREILETLSKKEIARQEAINELIYSEDVYKRDLETLAEIIVQPLSQSKPVIIASSKQREEFLSQVFGNYKELIDISTALFRDLLRLQQQQQPCITMIGDILIKHVAYFEDPFTRYCPRVPLAEYLIKAEEKENAEFSKFVAQTERNKRMRRLALRHFLLNPVTRMQRYPLLLEAILKKTEPEDPDYAYLTKCIDMIKKCASQSDRLSDLFKKRVEILEINDAITFKQGEFQDLQLTDPHRRLYYSGDLKRRRMNGIEMEKSDIHVFLFDHLVLMTKPRKSSTNVDEYRVWRRPIPLQMLHVGQNNQQELSSMSTSTGTASAMLVAATASSNASHYYLHGGPLSSSSSNTGLLPLTLQHLGQRGGVYGFLCSSEEKQKWVTAMEEAKSSLKKRLGEDVYDLLTLDDVSFRYSSSVTAIPSTTIKHGKVNCTVSFASVHNERKLAIGTDTGVYIKSIDNHQTAIRRVLSTESVTQLAVLDKYHILLVLADKTLKAYPLDMLLAANKHNSNSKSTNVERLGQELGQHIHFFQVGICNGKDLLIFKKKKNTSSIFTTLEPIYDLRDPKNQKYITLKTGFMLGNRSNHSWFKKYKEFYVGAESSNVHFLKSKLLIVCERGFEIIDPENLSVGGRDIPDKGDPQFNFVNRQADSIKPLAMYRVHDKFLLCYNKFAFYVNNRNGSLVQRGPQKLPLLCEWEGNPDNIIYQYPYIVAFSSQFIEVRHVDTGDLVQIIPGDQIRLTYYQQAPSTTDNTTPAVMIQGCMTHSQRSDVQHIFYLKLNPQRSNNARKFI
ncbi:MAG: CNH domain-containing protein [Benjaminiella poitrasii]|nr:MAG: CNH domain-containing protein [Benjaminiella poitrasii]